ncbi:DUF4445 domain-containing protein, partial [Desulfovibrio oxamicus]|nr:DUF4445 domain-containing protein [Nitratidesulfovibrio oxamicus]
MSPHFSSGQPPCVTGRATARPHGQGGQGTPVTPTTPDTSDTSGRPDTPPPPAAPGAVAKVTLPDGRIVHLPLPVQASSTAGPASTLAQLVWMSGQVAPPALCSGLGHCGRCAARFTHGTPAPHPADEAHFSLAELADGWRLLCRHAPPGPAPSPQPSRPPQETDPRGTTASPPGSCCAMAFTLPAGSAPRRSRMANPHPPDIVQTSASGTVPATGVPLLLAIDLGTTTLHWSALTPDGRRVTHGAELNPQMGAGSEVMSRLAVASSPQGLAALRRLTLAAVARI